MSNYLGIPDFIPQLQPFQPDLNFYSHALATKQSQYDQGLRQFNSIYGSVLNSPMLREDNIVRREGYFKTITQDVKKVAKLDLSIDQNVQQAKTLFDPILNDKHIVSDMVFTKKLENSFQTAEQYRNCIDAEKCDGEFWQTGVDALNYAAEEFKKANPDDSLRFQAPSYTPFQNVTKKALAAAKAAGFNTSYEYVDGRYDVTDTNGYLLLDRKNKDGSTSKGVLPQYLYGLFGNDQKVQDMYTTQAYVQRKSAAKQLAQQYGISEEQGESMYLNNIMTQVVPKLTRARQDLTTLRSQVDTDQKSLQTLAKEQGSVAGDGIHEAFLRLQDIKNKTEASQTYHDQVSNIISNAPKQSDIKTLRNRVDNIVANANFMDTIDKSAYEYAMATAKHEIKADPYKLAEFNNALDLNKAITLRNYDNQIWKEHQTLLGKIGGPQGQDLWQAAMTKGITPEQLAAEGIDRYNIGESANRSKVLKLGVTIGDQGKTSEPFLAAGDNFTTGHAENMITFDKAVTNYKDLSGDYAIDVVRGMSQSYRQAISASNPEKGKIIQDKIMADAVNMFKGTGIDPLAVMLGNQSIESIRNHPKLGQIATFAVESRKRDKASQLYNSNWNDDKFMQIQIADQTVKSLAQQRNIGIKNAVIGVINNIPYTGDDTKYSKEAAAYSALVGREGIVSPNQAVANYAKLAARYYDGDSVAAAQDFKDNYSKYYENLVSKIPAFGSKPGDTNSGGASAQNRIITQNVSGNAKLSQDYLDLKSLASDVVLNKQGAILTPNSNQITELEPSESTTILGNKVLEKILNGDTKDMNVSIQRQYIPQTQQVAARVTVDDNTARKLNGLKNSDVPLEEQKTFIVTLPSISKSGNDYINKVTPSPEDVLLRNEGQVLSVNLANKGSMSIANNGGNMTLNASLPYFDENTGTYSFKDVVPTILSDVSVNKALAIGKFKLDAAYYIANTKKAEFLKKQAQDARTR